MAEEKNNESGKTIIIDSKGKEKVIAQSESLRHQTHGKDFSIKDLLGKIKSSSSDDEINTLKQKVDEITNEMEQKGLVASIKSHFVDLQDPNKNNFIQARDKIKNGDLGPFIRKAKASGGWDDRYEGFFEAYRDGAVVNMDIAFVEASIKLNIGNKRSLEATLQALKKEKGLFGWGVPPDLEKYAENFVKESNPAKFPPEKHKNPYAEKIPLSIGAVAKDGSLEEFVTNPDLSPILDLTDKRQRDEFVMRNVEAFRNHGDIASWKGMVGVWLDDITVANKRNPMNPKEFAELAEKLKAVMAVAASAKAMQKSDGTLDGYLKTLLGKDDQGKPNLSRQDMEPDFLIHDNPEMIIALLGDPQIEAYYDKIIADAGLKGGIDYKWHKVRQADGSWRTYKSFVAANIPIAQIRERSRLVKYMKGSAREGGLDSYLSDILVREVRSTGNSVIDQAKAKIACEIFLIDIFPRFNRLVTQPERESSNLSKLKLQPMSIWPGSPLDVILSPTGGVRAKASVYTDTKTKVILDHIDNGIRPEWAINYVRSREGMDYVDTGDVVLVNASAVTNAKTLAKASEATYILTGGPGGIGIGDMSPKSLESMYRVTELLHDIYGKLVIKDKKGKDIPIGKHIVALATTQLMYAKALAATSSSRTPRLGELISLVIDPKAKGRPFDDTLQFLFGPDYKGNSGFFIDIVARHSLTIDKNIFKEKRKLLKLFPTPYAKQFYDATYKLLYTNDQRGGGYRSILNMGNIALRVVEAMAELITGGKR